MRILILLLTAAFIAAPALTPPFSGYGPDQFPVAIARPSIQPAGYAFGIWGVIYLWLLIHALFGLARRDSPDWARPAPALAIALALGTVWLAIALNFPLTATAAIIAMGAAAITAYLQASPTEDRWLSQAPLGLFAGWLTAASGVSLGVILAGYGLLSDTASALTMLVLILGVAIAVQRRRPSMPSYSVSVIWAAIGIAVVNWQANPVVAYAALIGAVLQSGVAIFGLRPRRQT